MLEPPRTTLQAFVSAKFHAFYNAGLRSSIYFCLLGFLYISAWWIFGSWIQIHFRYLAFYKCPICGSSVLRYRVRSHGYVFVQDVCPIGRSYVYIRFGDPPNSLAFFYMTLGIARDHPDICRPEITESDVLRHG